MLSGDKTMSRITALKKTYAMAQSISAQRGGAALRYFIDAVFCAYRHGTSPENYFVLRFFNLSSAQRGEYLTSGRSKAADRALNKSATNEDKMLLADKARFNAAFAEFVRRDSVYAPECGFAAFSAFLDRHEDFMVKPTHGTMGRGIERLNVHQLSCKEELFRSCRENKLLLEEIICQHPELERIGGKCVSSVRINAARGVDGVVTLIGACLKCGGAGACTDNFHSGGVAFPVDVNTGCVTGAGRNNTTLEDFYTSPATGEYVPDFVIPFWNEIINCVYRAMDIVPSIGYVGWDIAVTANGAELIEGNYSWPGGNIIQFDNIGKYKLLKKCVGEAND